MDECQARGHVPYRCALRCSHSRSLASCGFKYLHQPVTRWFKARRSVGMKNMTMIPEEVRVVQEMSEGHVGAGHKKQSSQSQVSVFAFLTPRRVLRNSYVTNLMLF